MDVRFTITKHRVALAALFVLAGVALGNLLSPLVGTALATAGSSAPSSSAGTVNPSHSGDLGELSLQAALSVRSNGVVCPAGTPPEADECFSRAGGGVVPGLGFVSEAYTFIVDTNSPTCVDGDILHASKGTLTVTGDRKSTRLN